MYRLSSIVFCFFLLIQASFGQSPHGKNFSINCVQCHSPENWEFAYSNASFSHDSTLFPLTGQHVLTDCRLCHKSLVFKDAKADCNSCHQDVHQQTVGTDCARCHTTANWTIEAVTQMHEKTSFPLMGVHTGLDCKACHTSESDVRYSPTGVYCIDCHRDDYKSTEQPNHSRLHFSEDCASCHSLTGTEWNTEKVDHSFFPLEKGHNLENCIACHSNGTYAGLTAQCYSCHAQDYNLSIKPNHKTSNFSQECTICHTIDPGWAPVQYKEHDASYFPIYSGKHQGIWTSCTECHTNEEDYRTFSCTVCHKNPETDDFHLQIPGYQYKDNACLGCHPMGDGETAFNHNDTQFPLTGAHTTTDCAACHLSGYKGTPTACKFILA